jgi:hypothetical protein
MIIFDEKRSTEELHAAVAQWAQAIAGSDSVEVRARSQAIEDLNAAYGEGQPCAKGETAAKTGCIPSEGDGEKKEGKKAPAADKEDEELIRKFITPEEDEALDARFRTQFKEEAKLVPNAQAAMQARRDANPRERKPRTEADINDARAVNKLFPGEIQMVSNPDIVDSTMLAHTDENGVFTEDRNQLHDKIRSFFVDHVDPVDRAAGERPIAIMSMGGTGSGKSTMIDALGIDEDQFVISDADAVKGQLPEYRQALASGAVDAAGTVHAESSTVARDMINEAMDTDRNVIVDGTGANVEKTGAMIDELVARGYDVKIYMPHVVAGDGSLDSTLGEVRKRIDGRGIQTGRILKKSIWQPIWEKVTNSFAALARREDVSEAILFDNSGSKDDPPKPSLQFKKGKAKTWPGQDKFVLTFLSHVAESQKRHPGVGQLAPLGFEDLGGLQVRYQEEEEEVDEKKGKPSISSARLLGAIEKGWAEAIKRQDEDSAEAKVPGVLDVREGEDDNYLGGARPAVDPDTEVKAKAEDDT